MCARWSKHEHTYPKLQHIICAYVIRAGTGTYYMTHFKACMKRWETQWIQTHVRMCLHVRQARDC